MTEYEVIIVDMTPCGGEKYANREVVEVETDDPEAWVREHSRHSHILDISTNAKGDTVITTGDGHGYITRYTFSE